MKMRLFCLTALLVSGLLLSIPQAGLRSVALASDLDVQAYDRKPFDGPILNGVALPPDTAETIFIPFLMVNRIVSLAPRVNAPYFTWGNFGETAVFWFGKVTPSENYTDVRVGYTDQELWVRVSVFDRLLWYDDNPTRVNLTAWDAITLLIDLHGNSGNTPDTGAYRFIGQLNWWEDRSNYQAVDRGNGSSWDLSPVSFITESGWQGNAPNDGQDDRGWTMTYHIKFSDLGLSGPPQPGVTWGLGVIMHDRDSQAGPPLADKTWPKTLDENRPGTWGQLSFGMPAYTPMASTAGGTVTIRNKLNGSVVKDADVGGSTNCGQPYNPNFFNGWGNANYAGATQVNIQNQANLGDWPCFSKFYISFPLDALPPGKIIRSARLTLYEFGGSDPSQAYDSLIQVSTVKEDWVESTITWNNAPYPWENISRTWVNPLPAYPGLPGVVNDWDVSQAVAEAYQNGTPLRLVFYDADYPMHSGKYFFSSDVNDGMPTSRPTLTIEWGY